VPAVVFAIPGDINLPTGGYTYDRRVLALLPRAGVPARHLPLPDGFPSPSRDDLAATARAFCGLPPDAVLLIDGLAYGAMPPEIVSQAPGPIVALVHHPLCLETGLPTERQAALKASETAALALARGIVVTSATTARALTAEFGIPAERITVAEPGTDPAPRALRYAGRAPLAARPTRPELLAAGSVVPRKGYDILLRALAQLGHLDWHLTIAGDRDRSPETTAALEAQLRFSGVRGRVRFAGAVDERTLAKLYDQADLFVMASLYEGYGMVLSEALARGLPIVTTTGGAAAETVPDRAALKVPPGDTGALARALKRALQSASLRKRLSDASWAAGQRLPRWEDTAQIVAGAIRDVASKDGAP
jgi:glycosyltransferase involved in cell wall biosynthesis